MSIWRKMRRAGRNAIESGKDYFYYARCFKNSTDFWLFQFACETKNTEEYKTIFEKWASSVTFDD